MQFVLSIPRCTCIGYTCDIGKMMNNFREKERMYEFLMGHDDNFCMIRIQIIAVSQSQSLKNYYHLIVEN